MSQPTCCKCRARPCRCKNYCQCGARIRGDQYRCGPCHEVYLATLPPEPDPAAEIARLQAELAECKALLAEERAVTAALRTMVLATEQSYYSWGAAMSESYAAERDAAVAARVKPRIAQVEQQARAAHGAKEQA